jgi:hypothetical protein
VDADGIARGEAGDITQDIDSLPVQAEPVDWARVAELAQRLVVLARQAGGASPTQRTADRLGWGASWSAVSSGAPS